MTGTSSTATWSSVYPVGAIYISASATSPASLFGGTWEQIQDKFLLCSGSTYSGNSTGGSSTINLSHTHSTADYTLSVSHIPAHSHRGKIAYKQDGYGYNPGAWEVGFSAYSSPLMVAGDSAGKYTNINAHSLAPTSETGGGKAHNHGSTGSSGSSSQSIMPPYLAVYVWKRTA